MSDRPQGGGGKRRALDDKNKDNAEDDEAPSIDPGEWKPSGDSEAIRNRRRVHVRRGAGPAPTEPAPGAGAPAAAPASSNPFAGVSLTPPAAAPANPFAGVSLVAPSAQQPEKKDEAAAPGKEAAPAPQPQQQQQPPQQQQQEGAGAQPAPAAADAPKEGDKSDSTKGGVSPAGAPQEQTPAQQQAGKHDSATAAQAGTNGKAADDGKAGDAAPGAPPAAQGGPSSAAEPGGKPAPTTTNQPTAGASPSTAEPAKPAGSNPFSALGSTSGTFGAGFGGGGFGALGAAAAKSGGGFGGFGGGGFGSFGSSAAGSTGAAPAFGGFSFGAGAFPPVAAAPLGAKPAKKKEDGEGGDEGEEQGEGEEGVQVFGGQEPSYKPAVSLPEQERKTGEEEERQLFQADGSLYEFDSADNKWRERGRGEFKVNASEAGTRMVMRQAGNLRLLLNAKVYEKMPVQLMPGNIGVTFGVVNAAVTAAMQEEKEATKGKMKQTEQQQAHAEGTAKPNTWAVRIKSAERVTALKDLLFKLRENPSAKGIGTDGGWDA